MFIGIQYDTPDSAHAFLIWFYGEYCRYVYKLAWEIAGNHFDTDDLVQEVWLRLCSKSIFLADFPKERHLSYISSTVKNTAISLARKKHYEYSLDFIYTLSYDEAEILNAKLDRQMKLQRFREVWIRVPPEDREILERKYILFQTDGEIALDLGIKSSSVRMYLTRARHAACSILSQHRNNLI